MRSRLPRGAGRLALALGAGGVGWWNLHQAAVTHVGADPDPTLVVGYALTGLLALLAGVFGLASVMAELVAGTLTRLTWTGRTSQRDRRYAVAQAHVRDGRPDEAMDTYRALAEDDPDDVQPHLRMMEIALDLLDDPDRAAAVYHHALATVRNPARKKELTRSREAAEIRGARAAGERRSR